MADNKEAPFQYDDVPFEHDDPVTGLDRPAKDHQAEIDKLFDEAVITEQPKAG